MTFRRTALAKTAAFGLALVLGQVAPVGLWAQAPAPASTPAASKSARPAPAAIDWAESLEAALKKARATNKKLLIAVYAPWCGWCKVMQAKTYPHPDVVRAVDRYYVAVRLNAETRDSLTFLGRRYGYQPETGMNELAFQLLNGRRSYPATVFVSAQAEVLSPVRGYLDPKTFVKLLTYFGEDAYLFSAWPDYERGPQSDSLPARKQAP